MQNDNNCHNFFIGVNETTYFFNITLLFGFTLMLVIALGNSDVMYCHEGITRKTKEYSFLS